VLGVGLTAVLILPKVRGAMKHGCSSEILQAAANATKRSAQKKCMLTQLLFEPKALIAPL
jgi:hypothetical protein